MNHNITSLKNTINKTPRSKVWFYAKRIVLAALVVSFLFFGSVFVWAATLELPSLDNFEERKVISSTKIYDRTGEIVLYDVNQNIKRTVVLAEEISVNARNAIVAIEDAEFYNHEGIRMKAIFRAVIANIRSAGTDLQGGSTLTQQVIKNTLLTTDRTITRKVKEWILALRLEKILSKEEILTLYLNEAPYGGSIYGIEQAAQSFFGKKALDITISESAYLASLPNAPTFFSPYGNNIGALEARKNHILAEMQKLGFITQDEYTEASAEIVVFRPQEETFAKSLHFVQWVQEYLEDEYGKDVIFEEGLTVVTTLDYELQKKAEEIVLKNALEQEELYDAENQGLIAIDPRNGEVLAMVGSRDYFDENIDGNFNVTLAERQPGSSFKPFIYYTAFKEGYTPDTILWDARTQFSTQCSPESTASGAGSVCYSPANYDSLYKGPLTVRNALGQSRNVPAVKMLYLVGINDSIETAEQAGITSLTDPERYGLTLVLGGGEVSLLEMTSAYGVFANDGIRVPPTGILKVTDLNGTILEEWDPKEKEKQVLDKQAVRLLNDILSDNVARTPLLGASSFMYFGAGTDVAAKTGTTNSSRDGWLIGYTPEIAVGVWTGNNDNRPMEKGSSISGPTWRAFMDEALKTLERERFPDPSPIEGYESLSPLHRGIWQSGEPIVIDSLSGKLATEFTPSEFRKEVFRLEPHSELYWINPRNPLGPRPETPTDNQFKNWEFAVQKWVLDNPDKLGASIVPPTEEDNIHTPENQPSLVIVLPQNGAIFTPESIIEAEVETQTGENPLFVIAKVDYYVNDQYIGGINEQPFSYNIDLANVVLEPGKAILRVVVYDLVLNRAESSIEIEIVE